MNTINEITATYQRIAEEGRSELNKVQNKIYRIGSLRLLLFVAGIAQGRNRSEGHPGNSVCGSLQPFAGA